MPGTGESFPQMVCQFSFALHRRDDRYDLHRRPDGNEYRNQQHRQHHPRQKCPRDHRKSGNQTECRNGDRFAACQREFRLGKSFRQQPLVGRSGKGILYGIAQQCQQDPDTISAGSKSIKGVSSKEQQRQIQQSCGNDNVTLGKPVGDETAYQRKQQRGKH